ncbi:hypothetical protein ACTXT7_011669 [Hymenolepis weldensis]
MANLGVQYVKENVAVVKEGPHLVHGGHENYSKNSNLRVTRAILIDEISMNSAVLNGSRNEYKHLTSPKMSSIGAGSFGTVYRGTWEDKLVALKVYHQESSQGRIRVIDAALVCFFFPLVLTWEFSEQVLDDQLPRSSRVQLSAFLSWLPLLFGVHSGCLEQSTAFVFVFEGRSPSSVFQAAFTFDTGFDSMTIAATSLECCFLSFHSFCSFS